MSLTIQEVTGSMSNYIQTTAVETELAGSYPAPISVTADPAPAQVNATYLVDSSGGAITVTLPLAPANGTKITVIDSTGSAAANNITLSPTAPDIISPSVVLAINNASAVALYNSGTWYGIVNNL